MKKNSIVLLLAAAFMIAAIYWTLHSKKALLIVEPRRHPDMKRVLEQFHQQMPLDWDLYIFHGASAGDFIEESTKNLEGRQIYLRALPGDNLKPEEYNELFKKQEFWNQVDAEDILVFQTDTALCGASPQKIERFRKYGYLGCSHWPDSYGMKGQPWAKDIPFYGIGGLSFRKKSFMLKCIRADPNVHPHRAEDVFFSECLHKETSELKPESGSVLADFCTQAHFNSESFGAHKTKLLIKKDKEAFYGYCPEARFLESQK